VRDGDEWIVNGQKVWTTGAHHAAYGMLLARTNWEVPKHQGITWFAFPMQQDGVEVRPLRQMNMRSSFNEVFLTGARVPHANVVGDVDSGWTVALTTLAHERGMPAARLGHVPSGSGGRTVQEAVEEATEYAKTYEWYPQRAGRPDLVSAQAKATGSSTDPLVRQEAARLHAIERTARWNVARALAARAEGRPPGPEGSLAKLLSSDIARRSSAIHGQMVGAHGMLSGPESPVDGVIAEILVSVPAQSIAGGTDEIQRNILGERALGLPRDPSNDRDRPFRELPRNL